MQGVHRLAMIGRDGPADLHQYAPSRKPRLNCHHQLPSSFHPSTDCTSRAAPLAMSGIEVAGLVFGAFPLIISAMEHGRTFVKVSRLHRRMREQRRQLLPDLVPQEPAEHPAVYSVRTGRGRQAPSRSGGGCVEGRQPPDALGRVAARIVPDLHEYHGEDE
jgi:hypothetical protein